MTSHHSSANDDQDKLTKNQTLVFDALEKSQAPLSAYTLLDLLRQSGLRAPPQVYRALEKLVAQGMVHKLESINAYVACRHAGCEHQRAVAFGICRQCGGVAEFSSDGLNQSLLTLAKNNAFSLRSTVVELHGECDKCASKTV
jgi:Fur family zinc uptake transcriptional regulator